jgi:hypothetical protein
MGRTEYLKSYMVITKNFHKLVKDISPNKESQKQKRSNCINVRHIKMKDNLRISWDMANFQSEKKGERRSKMVDT